jgi:hypothetical protein
MDETEPGTDALGYAQTIGDRLRARLTSVSQQDL